MSFHLKRAEQYNFRKIIPDFLENKYLEDLMQNGTAEQWKEISKLGRID